MESTEGVVKEFTKTTSVLPFTRYGLATCSEFKKAEAEVQGLEFLKRVGLTADEIKLYNDHKTSVLDKHSKLDKSVLQERLNVIFKKICDYEDAVKTSTTNAEASTSGTSTDKLVESLQKKNMSTNFYPEGHPMNSIKQLEDSLFSHHDDSILPLTKRRKVMRFLEKKQELLQAQRKELMSNRPNNGGERKDSKSLWDVKTKPKNNRPQSTNKRLLGPKQPTMYTIKDNELVKLEPTPEHETGEREPGKTGDREVIPEILVTPPEDQLMEGTKISVDDIRKMDRFRDYEPGIPSTVLYLKNVDLSVSQQQLSILFNQFVTDNGGPIDVRLMTGRMRGQAFVRFREDHVALQALEEINGTVVSGKPIIAEFGRISNNINIDDDR